MTPKASGFKATGALKKFIDAGKKDSRVLSSVERDLIARPEPSDRRSDVLHPSAMVKSDWCHRSSYFQLLGFAPPPSKYRVTLRQKRVFQTGHDIHAGWQTIFQNMGNLYGIYQCTKCGLKEWGMGDKSCPICDGTNFEYREVSLMYDKLRISGHADGILIGFGEPLMLEIKSVGAGTFRFEAPELTYEHNGEIDKMWKALQAPFMSHIMQAQMYMKLAELIGLEHQPQEALFLYENKATQEAKEFVVQKSDFGVTPILEAAQAIVDAVDNRTPPTCNISPNEGCYQCKGYENA
jgi:hypothetical protein